MPAPDSPQQIYNDFHQIIAEDIIQKSTSIALEHLVFIDGESTIDSNSINNYRFKQHSLESLMTYNDGKLNPELLAPVDPDDPAIIMWTSVLFSF